MKISSQSSEGRKRDLAVEGEAAEDVIRGKGNRVLDASKGEIYLALQLRFDVFGDNHEINAAANVEVSGHGHPFGFAGLHHVVQQNIGDIFVKVAFIAETPQILLETFRLKAFFARRIFDGDLREIGLAGHRAKRRELVGVKANGVRVVRMRVGKRFNRFRRLQRHASILANKRAQNKNPRNSVLEDATARALRL